MHFGKIPKKIGYNLAKIKQNSDKIFKNFQNFAKNQQNFQHFLTKKLRVENGAVQRSALCRSRREHSNEYLLTNFGFDTAENEPCKVCPLSAYRSPRFFSADSHGWFPSTPSYRRILEALYSGQGLPVKSFSFACNASVVRTAGSSWRVEPSASIKLLPYRIAFLQGFYIFQPYRRFAKALRHSRVG